jgi:IS1 family transposase
MNKLPLEKRVQILSMLCKGSSMRSISRVADVSINTVNKLLVDAGNACTAFHAATVTGVKSRRVQCDEIWSFCYSEQSNTRPEGSRIGRGDVWTWTALDADSKLIISWMVDDRDAEAARLFMGDLKDRLANRIQLTIDGHRAYLDAVEDAFGGDIDYAMLVKLYGPPEGKIETPERRYSPQRCVGARYQRIVGAPNEHYTSTSYTERHNLTIRRQMRRFTRLANAFSKKIDNHCHALALYFVFYNFIRTHKAQRLSPAMAAGLTDRLWDMGDIVRLTNEYEASRKRPQTPLPAN